jgi:hypothetical protein
VGQPGIIGVVKSRITTDVKGSQASLYHTSSRVVK